MCLDVVRALCREARLVDALISDLTEMSDGCSILTGELSHLVKLIRLNPEMLEPSARILSQQLVLIAQGCLLHRIRRSRSPTPLSGRVLTTARRAELPAPSKRLTSLWMLSCH